MKKLFLFLIFCVNLLFAESFFKNEDKFFKDCESLNKNFYTCRFLKIYWDLELNSIEKELLRDVIFTFYGRSMYLDYLHSKDFNKLLTQTGLNFAKDGYLGLTKELINTFKNDSNEAFELILMVLNKKLKEFDIKIK